MRSDEAPKLMRFRRAIWNFSFSTSSVLVTKPGLGRGEFGSFARERPAV